MQKAHAEQWEWNKLKTSILICKPSPYSKAHTQVNWRKILWVLKVLVFFTLKNWILNFIVYYQFYMYSPYIQDITIPNVFAFQSLQS